MTGTRWHRLLAVAGLLILAPIGAEYLYAYDESTGDPVQLIGNLWLFIPLYGAAAVLIREVCRRAGAGWPGILLLGAAFGLVEAGLVDQSLFNPAYRDIPEWRQMLDPTAISALGTSVALIQFIAGHMINSIAVPILVVESIGPRSIRGTPWVGRIGMVIISVCYLVGAGLVLQWHVETEGWVDTAAQAIGTAVVAGLLIVAGLTARHWPKPRPVAVERPVPWWAVSVGVAVLAIPFAWGAGSVVSTVVYVVSAAVGLIALGVLSGQPWWTRRHRAALVAVWLPVVVTAFWAEPLGGVSAVRQAGHHVFFAVLVVVLGAVAVHRSRPGSAAGGPAAAARP